MTALVFPDPPVSPVTLMAGEQTAILTVDEVTAPDPTVQAMYVTIVQLGAAGSCAAPSSPTSPTLLLQVADSAEVPVTGPVPLVIGVDGPPATIIGAGKQMTAYMRPLADGVFRVRISFPDGVTGEPWQMRTRNNDQLGRQLRYTWVVADSFAESRQPWIEASAAPATGPLEVLVNRSQDLTIPVQNLGTGPLEIVVSFIDGGFSIKTVPPPIPPNACANLVLTYDAAASPEAVSVFYDIESNDSTALATAGHNRRIALAAKSIMFEIGFVVDASGSMASRPNGTSPAPIDEQRWGKLRTAAGVFLDSLRNFGTGAGTVGVAVFPNVTQGLPPPASSAGVVLPATTIDPGSIAAAKEGLLNLLPGGGTPMGDGIEAVLGDANDTGFFNPGDSEVAVNRRWMVLMSDGAHNQGPPQPEAFTGTGPQSFVGKRVRAFTVAYGEPGAWEVRPGQLNLIATASGGVAQDAGVDDAGLELAKAFELALTTGLNLASIADPTFVLTGDSYAHRHTVLVTPFDRTVSFIVTWGAIEPKWWPRVWLRTPNGDLLDPDTATGEPGVTVDWGERYLAFTCDESYLQDGLPPRYGPWLLFVSNDYLAGTDREEPYAYTVVVDSRLKLDVSFDRARYAAGDPIEVAAALTVDGAPISDARILLYLTAPRQSAANWLAARQVRPEELKEAEAILSESSDRASRLRAKALAAAGFKIENMTFDPLAQTDAISMIYDGGQGRYAARTATTAVPGTYDFFVSILGATADGTPYRREARVQQRLDVRPGPYPDFTILDAVFQVGNEIEATLRIWPRDRFGNVVLVDPEYRVTADADDVRPETDQTIRVEVAEAEKDGPLVSNLDGSYSQKVRYARDSQASPLIWVFAHDEPIIEQLPLPTPVTHIFANDAVDFVEGAEAKQDVNAHDHPDDAARGVFPFAGDPFVALGGGGELTLGVDGAVIQAGSPDDVVVFVQPTAELRPYVVEAERVDGSGEWVRLGWSAGTTQGFTLVGLIDEARSIRIRDLSNRIYDDDLNPLDAPGVNILGVGFRQLG